MKIAADEQFGSKA